MKNLQAMVAGVNHYHAPVAVDSNALGKEELPVA
jgi:hypothetical protein